MKFVNNFIAVISDKKDLVEIIKGSSKGFLMKIGGLVSAQLFSFVVARYLGADIWGAFSLALSLITIGSIFGTLGLDIGLLKKVAAADERHVVPAIYRKSFFITLIASFVVSITVFFSAEYIAKFVFSKPELGSLFELAALGIIPLSLIKLNSQTFRGLKNITRYALIDYVARYLFALLLLPLVWLFISGNEVVLSAFIAGLYLIYFISQYWLYKEDVIFPVAKGSGVNVSISSLLKISLPLLFASSLVFVKGWIDTIMVGIFLPSAQVGIYFLSLKLSGVLTIILSAVNMIAAPKFSEAYSQYGNDKLEEIVQYATKLIFFTTLPLFLIFVCFPEQILSIFGEEFTAGSSALILLCIGNFVNAISGSVGYFMQMTGSEVAFQNITLATTALGIGLNYFLIPLIGIEGAALSTCIGLICWNASCTLFIKHKYNLSTYYIPFIK